MTTVVTSDEDVERVREIVMQLHGVCKVVFEDGSAITGLVESSQGGSEYKKGSSCSAVLFVIGQGRVSIDVSGRVASIGSPSPEDRRRYEELIEATGGILP